jgi:hypothetical protein
MIGRILCWLWEIWIPTWEGERNPWLKARATAMFWVRSVWYLGRKTACLCEGCKNTIPKANASWLCRECAEEECEYSGRFGDPC